MWPLSGFRVLDPSTVQTGQLGQTNRGPVGIDSPYPSAKRNPFEYYNTSPEVIRLTVLAGYPGKR